METLTNKLPPGVYRYTVSAESDGLRLDQFLANCREDISRGLARRLIEIGGVHLDGRRMRRCGQVVAAGQQLELFVDGLPLAPFELESHHILYQDADLLVINKPAGIATQPTPARYRGTLYDALLRFLESKSSPGRKPSLGMVQRLDRDTSGVMVFSIHPRAHKALTRLFHDHHVEKVYLALVSGEITVPSGVIRSQLARRRSTNRTVTVEKGGRYAETQYEVCEQLNGASLVQVKLVTGRTHQIRAHFAESGHPLIGDTSYGGVALIEGCQVPRHMLHARDLRFAHPVTGQTVAFQAPLPEDFAVVLKHLGGHTR